MMSLELAASAPRSPVANSPSEPSMTSEPTGTLSTNLMSARPMPPEFSGVSDAPFVAGQSSSATSGRVNRVIEQTNKMKHTFTLTFSREAIVAMAENMPAFSTVEATPNDLIDLMCGLGQPLRLTGANAVLETQMGPWLWLCRIANEWGSSCPKSPAAAADLTRLTASEARGFAAALRDALSMVPVVPTEIWESVAGIFAVCDGGEVQIERVRRS